jgi:hypothetical protein
MHVGDSIVGCLTLLTLTEIAMDEFMQVVFILDIFIVFGILMMVVHKWR